MIGPDRKRFYLMSAALLAAALVISLLLDLAFRILTGWS